MPQFVAERRERRSRLRRFWRALLPRERQFFVLFNQQAELSVEALSALVDLLRNVSDPDGRVRDIEAIEKRGDGVVA
ncbi:MAG TPA: hypothetical protein VFR86_22025, partial [Burkholderiaceae bacterium]|nr:hypothetical protein [Burkholderiaceae bacterium]